MIHPFSKNNNLCDTFASLPHINLPYIKPHIE